MKTIGGVLNKGDTAKLKIGSLEYIEHNCTVNSVNSRTKLAICRAVLMVFKCLVI